MRKLTIPVLTKTTGEVAARGPERKSWRTRQKVVERFLFDRVDAEPARTSIRGEDDLVASPGPHEAQTALAIEQPTGPRAEVALQLAVFESMPVAPGNLRAGFCKISHGLDTLPPKDAMGRERVKLEACAAAVGGQAVKPK